MADHTGVVEKVYKKHGTNKNGKPYTLYSAKVQGLEQWASFGFKDPEIDEGDVVKLRGEIDDRNFRVSQHRIETKGEGKPAAQARQGGGGKPNFAANAASRDAYFKDKEKHDREEREPRIQYQAARKDALEFLQVLAAQDALPITAASGKGNKAKRFEELEEIVDKLTVRFYKDTLTLRVLERVQDSEEGVAPVAIPEDVSTEADDLDDFDNADEEVPF